MTSPNISNPPFKNHDLGNSTWIFVYGTLMNGQWNHPVISGEATHSSFSQPKFTGSTVDSFHFLYSHIESFPIAVLPSMNKVDSRFSEDTRVPIRGQVFDVCNKVLARVRRLEGFPTWYNEKKVLVNTDCGKVVEAVMYVQEKHQFLGKDLLYFSVDGDFTTKKHVEIKF